MTRLFTAGFGALLVASVACQGSSEPVGSGADRPLPSSANIDVSVSPARIVEFFREGIDTPQNRALLGDATVDSLLAQIGGAVAQVRARPAGLLAAPRAAGLTDASCNPQTAKVEKDGVCGTMTETICDHEFDTDKKGITLSFLLSADGCAPATRGFHTLTERTFVFEADACPSAKGKVTGALTIRIRSELGTTTTSAREAVEATGQVTAEVGDDAQVDHYDLDLQSKYESTASGNYAGHVSMRGLKLGASSTDLLDQISGAFRWTGPGDWPAAWNAVIGLSVGFVPSVLEKAQAHWNGVNQCLVISTDPDAFDPKPGEAISFTAVVTRKKDGAGVETRIVATVRQGQGEISPAEAATSPGDPARFTYTAPKGDVEASYSLEVTSRAGKAVHSRTRGAPPFIARLVVDEEAGTLEAWTSTPSCATASKFLEVGGHRIENPPWTAEPGPEGWGFHTVDLPPGWSGDTVLGCDDYWTGKAKRSNVVPLTEWVIPITFTDRTDMFGSYQATVTAVCRFRGDVHWAEVPDGPLRVPPETFPVFPESTSTASYSMSQQFQIGEMVGQASGAGTLAQVVRVGPTGGEPAEPSFFLCEGELDATLSELRLSLRAFQRDGVQGTSNLGSSTADFTALVSVIGQTQVNWAVLGMVFTIPLSARYDIAAGNLTGQGTWEYVDDTGTHRGTIDQELSWPAVTAVSPPP